MVTARVPARAAVAALVGAALVVAACTAARPAPSAAPSPEANPSPAEAATATPTVPVQDASQAPTPTSTGSSSAAVPAAEPSLQGAPTTAAATAPVPAPTPALVRPAWLGTRPLPLGPDGYALPQPTPPELVERRLPTIDLLPPPADGAWSGSIEPLTAEIAARATWTPECPVGLDDLRYLRMAFWGFDDRAHTGEMVVHASVADDVVEVFRQLFEARFPIEEMRLVTADELDGPPTGDGNDTAAFVCRPVRGGSRWSEHASGLAVDINPFHNPYRRGDRVLPELASAYLDRSWVRPGMVVEGDVVVRAFDAIGWGWGGRWSSVQDAMHFSRDDR